MFGFWNFFLTKKNFSYILLTLLIIFGLNALFSIPKENNPEVTVPIGIVSTTLPGASALDIEELITNKLEAGINNNLDNIKRLTSSSAEGVSSITVEFEAEDDIDKSIQELKDEVDKVVPELPDEATDPFVFQIDFANQPIITFSISGELSEQQFISLTDDLEDELKRIQGVSDVSISGKRERETQVIVKREALANFGLNISDVITAIRQTNNTLPAGNIVQNGIQYNVQFEGDINDPSEIADIAILAVGENPIYVRDIAEVVDGYEKERSISRTSINGEPSQASFTFDIFKRSGGDVTQITSSVRDRLEELQQPGELLDGIETLIVFDTGELLTEELTNLTRTGLQTVLLVMLLLFATIGWREALIAGSAIPLSFLVAFIGLKASGNTLNFVSLFSLILSVGILVDSAIVIVEGTHTKMKQWMDKEESARETVRLFNIPLISGTMTTVAFFAPLLFISGITGEFIASIPFTVIFVLIAAMFVSLGFIPLIASIFLRRRMTSKMEEKQEHYTACLQTWYKAKLNSILGNRKRERVLIWTLVVLLISSISFPMIGAVKVVFFEQNDADYIIVEIETPQGTVLQETDLELRKAEEILLTVPEIEAFTATAGAGSSFGSGASGEKFANAFIILRDDRERISLDILQDLRKAFVDIKSSEVRATQPSDGPPVGTPIVIKFFGDNLQDLELASVKAARLLQDIPGTSDVTTSSKDDSIELLLTMDKAKAVELGLNPTIVSQTLRAAIHGVDATTIRGNEDDIDVVVKLDLNPDYLDAHDTTRTTIDAVRQIEIQSPNGPLLLGSVLESSVGKSSAVIRHENRKRVATAGSELTATGNTRQITTEFKQRSDELNLPEGVDMQLGGENEEVDQSFAEMGYAFIIGLVLAYIILVLQFDSFRHPLYVVSVIMLSIIGVMFGLMLSQNALSFSSLMGLIALSGIVVNNSIILIDTYNRLRENHPDMSIHEVVIEGSAARLRPILLTTITTVVGIFPLTWASELWAPIAYAIMFGLSFAVVMTLVLVPILYNRKPGRVNGATQPLQPKPATNATPVSNT